MLSTVIPEKLMHVAQGSNYYDAEQLEFLPDQKINPLVANCDKTKIVLEYVNSVKYNPKDDLLQMLPIVIYYNITDSQIELCDIIHFNTISIKAGFPT